MVFMRAWGIAAGAAGSLVLAGCATPVPNPQEHRLFGEVYHAIVRYHLEDPHIDEVALAGLGGLAKLDPGISVTRAGDEVVLSYGLTSVKFRAPPGRDENGWGELTARALDTARSISPAAAAAAPDAVDEEIIDAGLATLDPFSRYARPEIARERRAARDGFAGVGVTLNIQDSSVRVASVLRDTPAAAAGLLVEDRIVTVDGVATASLDANAIRQKLRGPTDTPVTLEISRDGMAAPLRLVMRRARIRQPTVSLEPVGDVAWLKVHSFSQQTAALAAELLGEARERMGPALKGVVLDLRDNPGGLLDQSIELAGLFLDGGMIASTIGRVPQSYQTFPAPAGGQADTLPLAVLVNGSTASAAELVAAALQDAGRAVVIGTSSFGKGTVQTVLRTGNDGELTVTWAQLVAPRGYLLHRHGVVPTICSAGLGEGDTASLLPLLAPAPPEFDRPREQLDELGWQVLRAHCPAERGQRAVDLEAARRLLDAPLLYRAALAAGPGGPARNAEARINP
jgi:carboxyl-terminal processing protease